MKATITKRFRFEAGQHLPNLPEGHKCRRPHGHTFFVEISVKGDVDPNIGWVYDHAILSKAMKPLIDLLDHSYLNDIEGLEIPTMEHIAGWFWKKLEDKCPGLCQIRIKETPNSYCTFNGFG